MAPVPDETPIARRRASNDRIANAATAHRFDGDVPVPFICECADTQCGELLRLTLDGLRAARRRGCSVVASGHAEPEAVVQAEPGYCLVAPDRV